MEDSARARARPLSLPRITPRRTLAAVVTTLLFLACLALYHPTLLDSLFAPTPPDDIWTWGVPSPSRAELTRGLFAWPAPPSTHAETGSDSDPESETGDDAEAKAETQSNPAHPLGAGADTAFTLGWDEPRMYWLALEQFVVMCFPKALRKFILTSVKHYKEQAAPTPWDASKTVWQTDKDGSSNGSRAVGSWRSAGISNEGWLERLVTDPEGFEFVSEHFGGSRIETLYKALPAGILRADTLRYLFLLTSGGIYTDTDTRLLRPPSQWGRGADVHRGPWLSYEARARLDAGEEAGDVLGPPAVVVGIEADVGDRADWQEWWSRPIQIVQWTMGSAPHHPILLHALLRILHQTGSAADWAARRWQEYTAMRGSNAKGAEDVLQATVMSEPKEGGPIGVVNWTGPGVFTDAVVAYLLHAYGVEWVELRGLRRPLRIGDVVVLPVTGFSPGVGQFGAGEVEDPQAMVWHLFRGSWKTDVPQFNGDALAREAW